MNWYFCKAGEQLRKQVDELWPGRDRTSDGTIGDTSHSARKSDHNPNAAGAVTAWDCDLDLSQTEKVGTLVASLQASRDPRLKYLIFNAQITTKGDITQWQPYHGTNAHRHHAHISFASDPALYDGDRTWDLSGSLPLPAVPLTRIILKFGDAGPLVVALQNALGILADGDFGKETKAALMKYQSSHNLTVDGKAGDTTRRDLGLIA